MHHPSKFSEIMTSNTFDMGPDLLQRLYLDVDAKVKTYLASPHSSQWDKIYNTLLVDLSNFELYCNPNKFFE